MNVVEMLERCREHLDVAKYGPARRLAKIVGEALEASKNAPETLGNYANCCHAQGCADNCQFCWFQSRDSLALIKSKLGIN